MISPARYITIHTTDNTYALDRLKRSGHVSTIVVVTVSIKVNCKENNTVIGIEN